MQLNNPIPDIESKIGKLVADFLEKEIKDNNLEVTMTIQELIIFLRRGKLNDSSKD